MIRALWTASTGMQSQQVNMDVIANNLANVNSSGLRRAGLISGYPLSDQSAAGPGSMVAKFLPVSRLVLAPGRRCAEVLPVATFSRLKTNLTWRLKVLDSFR